MGKKVAGTCYVKTDGTQLTITGGVEAPLTDTTRESVVPGFYTETERIPYLNVTAVVTPDFPRKQLVEGTDMTITAEMANGSVYVLSGAYLVDEPAYAGDDGTCDLVFNGRKGIWQ